eukprot:5449825-Pleurochrysis_carterae.AAC.1
MRIDDPGVPSDCIFAAEIATARAEIACSDDDGATRAARLFVALFVACDVDAGARCAANEAETAQRARFACTLARLPPRALLGPEGSACRALGAAATATACAPLEGVASLALVSEACAAALCGVTPEAAF